MKTLLAVDLSYQCYRATAAHRTLSYGPHFTGGLYGFLLTLAKIILETGATRVMVCSDVKPYLRSLEYPQYKLLRREKADEELLAAHKESLPLIEGAMRAIQVPVIGWKGFESDDFIGRLLLKYRHRFDLIYAASNDSDLYQLLRVPNFRIIKGSDRDSIVSAAHVAAGPYGMTPEEFMLAQALQGTHNDVEGIPGIGPVKAFRAVKNEAAMRKLRERWGEVIDRNMRLQELPHPLTPSIKIPEPPPFNPRALYSYCAKYGIEATKSMIDAFEQITQ